MKKYSLAILLGMLITLSNTVLAQSSDSTIVTAKDTAWKGGGVITATFSQSAFDNWSGGGENGHSLNGRATVFGNYILPKVAWENTLDIAYGFTQQNSTGFRKNDDFFDFRSKLGYKASPKWFVTFVFNLKSQFYEGKDYSADPVVEISDFLSPLYMNMAPGLDYKPNKQLSAFISPVNAKLTYVKDSSYNQRYNIKDGESMRTEFGFIFNLKYEKNLLENLSLMTKFDVFYDYLDAKTVWYEVDEINEVVTESERVKMPYLSWEVLLNFKVYKMFAINLNMHLIRDDNFRKERILTDGTKVLEDPKLQFKEVFGFGISYTF